MWTLPIAMGIGALGYRWIEHLAFLTPIFIFVMLFLTFCRIDPHDLQPHWGHLWLLLIELGGAVVAYYLVLPFSPIAAEGAMVCVICPTATAAAVVTGKLHGNMASITTYTLICNIAVALAVPILFPLVTENSGMDFWTAFIRIMAKVFPLLICPFLLATLLRYCWRRMHARIAAVSGVAFYLWAVGLSIVTAQTVHSILNRPTGSYAAVIWMILTSLFVCVLQFWVGKHIGTRYADRIACGQALGQKNTLLAIWMTQVYLNPFSSLSPGLYVIWQNTFNSWQLWREQRKLMDPCEAEKARSC